MTFIFDKEHLTAVSPDGSPMGSIHFPRIRPDLVNISDVSIYPGFQGQGVAEAMMEALLTHLTTTNRKAALTSPFAQQYVRDHGNWQHILPGQMHFTAH